MSQRALLELLAVDCSVSIAWLLEEQADDYTEAALDALASGHAVAPRWWNVEVVNVLLTLEPVSYTHLTLPTSAPG